LCFLLVEVNCQGLRVTDLLVLHLVQLRLRARGSRFVAGAARCPRPLRQVQLVGFGGRAKLQ
jgi:hypothetical protein